MNDGRAVVWVWRLWGTLSSCPFCDWLRRMVNSLACSATWNGFTNSTKKGSE